VNYYSILSLFRNALNMMIGLAESLLPFVKIKKLILFVVVPIGCMGIVSSSIYFLLVGRLCIRLFRMVLPFLAL
jgi:hypothetical protein